MAGFSILIKSKYFTKMENLYYLYVTSGGYYLHILAKLHAVWPEYADETELLIQRTFFNK